MNSSRDSQLRKAKALVSYIEAGGDVELTFEPPLHLVTADDALTLRAQLDRERFLRHLPMSY